MRNPAGQNSPARPPLRHRARPVLRIIRNGFVGVVLVIGLFSALQAFSIYTHNRAADSYPLPSMAAPQPVCSLLVVSPHPDDETLGAGGLLMQAKRRGCPVHVVFLTNGDAFRVGASRYYKTLRLRPEDCIRYGEMRETESRAALGRLGLAPSDITFLGYPDRGMMPMWEENWLPSHPYTSGYTHVAANPYPDAPSYHGPYCGSAALADLTAAIGNARPTEIFVTHPNDDHPDHAAAPAYVNAAVDALKRTGEPWTRAIRVHYYLVHRGDWPVPQGLDTHAALAPPDPMLRLDTQWRTLPLDPETITSKQDALTQYASQEMMMKRFLTSFIRKNEVFGDVTSEQPAVPLVSASQIRVDGDPRDWPNALPLALDPSGDTVLRDFQAGGDIKALYVCRDAANLYLRMDARGALSPEIAYRLTFRCFDDAGKTAPRAAQVTASPRMAPAGQTVSLAGGAQGAWQGNTLEVSIPLKTLGPHPASLYLRGETKFSQITIDTTGYRIARF